jgi:FtsP/CotA-like multicopper oxidase with cupredoxin domain
MIHKIGSYLNIGGMIYSFYFAIFILIMLAFETLEYNAFTESQPSPLDGMNFSKSQDVFSKDGVLQTTITAAYKIGNVDNQSITSMVYNGSLGGPTLHVYPGERIELNLINNLNESTNIHYHGLHVSPSNNSDNVFLEVAPGETQQYIVDIPIDQPVGAYWYHSHMHTLAYEQVSAGLSGMIVVEGIEKLLPKPLQDIKKQTFTMRDFPVNSDPTQPTYRTVNGEINPDVNIKPGETQLWRLANIGSETVYKVGLPGHKFHVIAEDGYPVWEVWDTDNLVLPSGKRFDVLVTPMGNGSIPFKALDYYPYPETTIATINVQGNPKEPVKTIPSSLTSKEDLNIMNITNNRVLTFSSNDEEQRYTINNKTFDHNRIDQKVKLGTVEQWRLINTDEDEHPFHIHVNDFQVITVNGEQYDSHGLQDIVLIPGHGEVVIRIPFEDFVGKSVYHCHIMFHEDNGMMGVFEIVE